AHGSGVSPPIGVPADLPVNRADIQTGRATDASEGVTSLEVLVNLGAAIIHDDDEELFGSVDFIFFLGTAVHGNVGGEPLAGAIPTQEPDQMEGILHRGNDL